MSNYSSITKNEYSDNKTKYFDSKTTNHFEIFELYIKKKKCNTGDKTFTHTWWEDKNSYIFKILDNEYDEFIKLYANAVEINYGKMHVLEKPLDIGPLYFDYDFKQKNAERIIQTDDIFQIIEVINEVINKYYKLDNQTDLTSYVMTKKKPFYDVKRSQYSDGFHIHYPHLILNSNDKFLIFHESKNKIIKLNILSEIYDSLIEPSMEIIKDNDNKKIETFNNAIFDKRIIKTNSWFMYGSGKKINDKINLYEIEYIYDHNVEQIEIIPKKNVLVKLFSIRSLKISNVKARPSPAICDKMEEINRLYVTNTGNKHNVEKYFVKNENENENITEINNSINKTMVYSAPNPFTNTYSTFKTESEIIIARKFVKILNKKRAHAYTDWFHVGWVLYNVSPSLLPEFIEFSKLDKNKFCEGHCENLWPKLKKYGRVGSGIAALYKWAEIDNIVEYKKIMREVMSKLLDEGDIKTDFDVACIIKEIYKYSYVCTSIRQQTWCEFNDIHWNSIENAYTLSVKMSTDVAKEFAILGSEYMQKAACTSGQDSDRLLKKSKDILKLIQDLKKKTYKEKIISECANLFYQKDFLSKLDQNIYLVGFDNGIYDLKNRLFRKGCPDDMVSKSTKYAYTEYSYDDQIIIDIENFLSSIQPQEDMRLYLMCYCASFFEASNRDQKFMIWIGAGSNGKGTLIDLLDNTFGEYFGTLPPTILTQKRGSSSAATPELADKFAKRLITLQEIEVDDKVNIGFMKNITGQDKIEARPLFGDPFSYTPLFKLLLACNHLPNIQSDDGGTWRRIRVVDFFIKFVSDPTEPNERPTDPYLREKIKTWSAAFAWLLINKYYPIYVEKGLDNLEPERVKISTNKYKQDSNIYTEYVDSTYDVDVESSISKEDAWELFKNWYGTAYGEKKSIPPLKKFIDFFDGMKYKMTPGTKGVIYGLKMKELQLGSLFA